MAIKDYLPKKDEALRAWAVNFGALIDATPEAFGVTKVISSEFVTKQQDCSTKLQAASLRLPASLVF